MRIARLLEESMIDLLKELSTVTILLTLVAAIGPAGSYSTTQPNSQKRMLNGSITGSLRSSAFPNRTTVGAATATTGLIRILSSRSLRSSSYMRISVRRPSRIEPATTQCRTRCICSASNRGVRPNPATWRS